MLVKMSVDKKRLPCDQMGCVWYAVTQQMCLPSSKVRSYSPITLLLPSFLYNPSIVRSEETLSTNSWNYHNIIVQVYLEYTTKFWVQPHFINIISTTCTLKVLNALGNEEGYPAPWSYLFHGMSKVRALCHCGHTCGKMTKILSSHAAGVSNFILIF